MRFPARCAASGATNLPSRHDVGSCVYVGDVAGHIASLIADEKRGHCTHILDADEPMFGRSGPRLVDETVEMLDTRSCAGLQWTGRERIDADAFGA